MIDLHCHTTASDGTLTPAELVSLAARRGLRTIAVTDHDTTAGLDEALQAAQDFLIEVVPGIEINTDVPEDEVHILGYYIDWHDERLQRMLTRLREGRRGRAERMVRKLADLGAPISLDRVLEIAGQAAVARPHIAQALVEAGHVADTREAFERYIGRSGPAYAERPKFTPVEAVRLIRSVGGVPVYAHPVIAGFAEPISEPLDPEAMLPELCAAGLMGLEAYYAGYPGHVVDELVGLARKYRLFVTGGSDYHGPGRGHAELGEVNVPRSCLRALKRAHQQVTKGEE